MSFNCSFVLKTLSFKASVVFSTLLSSYAYGQAPNIPKRIEDITFGTKSFSAQEIENIQQHIFMISSYNDRLNDQINESSGSVKLQSEIEDDENNLIVTWDPLPVLSSKDGQYSFRTNGRIIYDYGIVNFKGGNGISRPADKINDTEFRALEFGFRGTLLKDFSYRFVATFVDNKTEVKMVYADYSFNNFSVTAGFTRTFATLEKSTPAPNTSFAERAAFINAVNIDRRVGIGVSKNGDNWTASIGYYFKDLLTTNSTTDDTNLISSRVTYSPVLKNGVGLHFGATAFYRNNKSNDYSTRYSTRPFSHQGDLKPLSSERFNITSEQFYSFEFVSTYQSFAVQSEYGLMKNSISVFEILTQSDPNYHGGYFEVSYFPTGGERTMNGKRGRFNDVDVRSPLRQGGIGEFKLAARYDLANFTHETYGKKQASYIFGVDWFLNNYVKLQGNYAHSIVKNHVNIKTDIVDTFNLRFLLNW